MDRTPTEYRRILAPIMRAMPKNDSDVIPRRPRQSASPRHRDLADEMSVLKEWRRLADPVPEFPATWCAPANDNDPAMSGGVEAEWEIRPTEDELLRAHHKYGPSALKLRNGKLEIRAGRHWVAAKDNPGTPYGASVEEPEDRAMAIAALRFLLDYIKGSPVEPAEPIDEHFARHTAPWPDNVERAALRRLLDEYGVTGNIPLNAARERHGLPPAANDNRPAFPYKPEDPRELFHGYAIKPNPTRTSERESSIFDRVSHEEERAYLRGKLRADYVKALDVAIEAKNFSDVGAAFGISNPKVAERRGKEMVLAACAELSAILRRSLRLREV